MNLAKIDLIIHPVRFRILQTLLGESLTTQEIAARLPDVAKSSIYRHLKLLRQEEMISVAETQLVHGIQEKVYQLAQDPYLDVEDMAGLTADEHLRYFTIYVLTLMRGFAAYLAAAEAAGEIDMLADRVGYTESVFFATDEELVAWKAAMGEVMATVAENEPGNGRHKHKIAIIAHPVKQKETTHE